MNRRDFLKELGERLQGMGEGARLEALNYFDELIQDKALDSGRAEEDVIAEFGPMADIVKALREGEGQQAATQSAASDGREQGDTVTKTAELEANQVRELIIRAHDMRVIIRPGAAENIVLHYPETPYHRFDLILQDGLLQLAQRRIPRVSLFGGPWWFGRGPGLEVILQLPREYAGTLDGQTSNGRIHMEGIAVWGKLRLHSSNGRIELQQCRAKAMDISTSNGRLVAAGLAAQGAITLNTSNGSVEARDVRCEAGLHIASSNGRLQVSGLNAADIGLYTSNSSIEGSLTGSEHDYSVTSSTSNGRNSLKGHSGSGGKRLDVRTSNGSIRLQFEQV